MIEQIEADLKTAMLARDSVTVSVLRMIKGSLGNEAIAKRAELSKEEIMTVLRREVKRRNEAAALYDQGNDSTRAEAERAEAAIIARYLPEPLTDEELQELVESKATELGEVPMGQLIQAVLQAADGRVDGGRVSAAIRERQTQ